MPEKNEKKQIEFSVALTSDLQAEVKVKAKQTDVMLDVLVEGAKKIEVDLLPNDEHPLDRLRGIYDEDHLGDPIDLNLIVDEFIESSATTERLAIELVLLIRVNQSWREAIAAEMSPRQILGLFGLSFEQYTLYNPGETDMLPLDVPITLERGRVFEAQKDGKYGQGSSDAD